MKAMCSSTFVLAVVVVLVAASPVSADNFLVVNDASTTSCDAIEAQFTIFGHTFTRLDATAATALTVSDVRDNYNATFWMGPPSGGAEQDWCIALMTSGGNLLVADNDFAFFYCDGTAADLMCTDFLESTYVSDAGSDGVLTGQGIMSGINPDISADPYPDDFTISGTNGSVIFDAPSTNAAGTFITRTVGAETYSAIYLSWDFVYTPATDIAAVVDVFVVQLSQPLLPVELMSFSIE